MVQSIPDVRAGKSGLNRAILDQSSAGPSARCNGMAASIGAGQGADLMQSGELIVLSLLGRSRCAPRQQRTAMNGSRPLLAVHTYLVPTENSFLIFRAIQRKRVLTCNRFQHALHVSSANS